MSSIASGRRTPSREEDSTDLEQVPVDDVTAGDWIVISGEEPAEPVRLHWRTGHRSPDGQVGWVLQTSGGQRRLGLDARVARVTSGGRPTAPDPGADGREEQSTLETVQVLALEEERSAEHSLVRAVFVGVAIAIPVGIVVWVGLVALAVRGGDPDWGPWIGMAAVIGVLNGVFFGALAGFVSKAHTLDDVDQHATHMVESARSQQSERAAH